MNHFAWGQPQIERVVFHDDIIEVLPGSTEVVLQSVTSALEIKHQVQTDAIRGNPVYTGKWAFRNVSTPGGSQDTFCISLKILAHWLNGIEATRVPEPRRREKLIRYQTKCVDHLYSLYFGSARTPETQALINGVLPRDSTALWQAIARMEEQHAQLSERLEQLAKSTEAKWEEWWKWIKQRDSGQRKPFREPDQEFAICHTLQRPREAHRCEWLQASLPASICRVSRTDHAQPRKEQRNMESMAEGSFAWYRMTCAVR
jgi:P22_AR N-terminal domain